MTREQLNDILMAACNSIEELPILWSAIDSYVAVRSFAKPIIIGSLPSVDEAGISAVEISEKVQPNLSAKEQAMFVAGFQECVKWLKIRIQ